MNLDLNSETFVFEFHVITVLTLICICLHNLFASIVLGLFFSHLSEKEILKLKWVDLSWRSIITFKVVLFSLISKKNFSLSNNSVAQVSTASISHEQLVAKGVWAEVSKAGGKPVVQSSSYAYLGVMFSWNVLIYYLLTLTSILEI